MSSHRGPGPQQQLPYRMLAGVVPCRNGWLVQAGRLTGISLFPIAPVVMANLQDVMDWKPAFEIIAIHMPLGLPSVPGQRRRCDTEARQLLGRRRGMSIMSAPARAALSSDTAEQAREVNGSMSTVAWQLMPKMREADKEIASYNQRVVHEVHPELSFYEMNGATPTTFSKHTAIGRLERRQLLELRAQNMRNVLDVSLKGPTKAKMLDACACLWTARRIAARGAAARLPADPEWDEEGKRMEIWR